MARKIDVHTFDYVLPDGPAVPNKKNNNSSKGNNKEVKSKLDEYKEGLRDYQNGQINKLGNEIPNIFKNSVINTFFFTQYNIAIQTSPMPKECMPISLKISPPI